MAPLPTAAKRPCVYVYSYAPSAIRSLRRWRWTLIDKAGSAVAECCVNYESEEEAKLAVSGVGALFATVLPIVTKSEPGIVKDEST